MQFTAQPRLITARRLGSDSPRGSNRRFTAGLTAGAAALALVLSLVMPAPAKADGDDLAKALIGALVVGAIIKGSKKDKPAPQPEPVQGGQWGSWNGEKPGAGAKPIPATCAIQIDGKSQDVALYPETCIRDMGIDAALPRDCATGATIFGHRDRVYGESCLRKAGFRLAGR